MPSVTVVWKGSCSEPRIRYRLLGHLNRLASRSGEYLDEAQPKRPALRAANKQRAETLRLRPNIETFDREISGSILISNSISQNPETIVARARDDRLRILADGVRDQNRTGYFPVEGFNIRSQPKRLCALLVCRPQCWPFRLSLVEIFAAPRCKPIEVPEQPIADARLATAAFPDDGDGGHLLLLPPGNADRKEAHIA